MLTTSFPLSDNTVSGVFILRLIESLPDSFGLTVLTPAYTRKPDHRGSDKYVLKCFRYAPKSWQKLAHQPGGIIVSLKKYPHLFFLLPFFILSMFFSCLRLSRKADVIHANWSINGVIAGFAGLLTRKPVITTLRGLDIQRCQDSSLDNLLLRICLRINTKIITVSDAIKDTVAKKYPHRAHRLAMIPNGVGGDFLRIGEKRLSGSRTQKVKMITVGSLIPRKGIETILYALKQLGDLENIFLHIVGDGPEKEYLSSLTHELDISEHIHFVQEVAPQKIPEFLANSDFMILSSYSEGRPNVVLEAMATGLAVIASNIDGTRELIKEGKTGLVFEPGNAAQLAEKIKKLAQDPVLRNRLGNAGRQFIIQNGLTWEHAALRYSEIYHQIQYPAK